MKGILSDYDSNPLNKRVAEIEERTNVQVVLAVIQRCDSYAELPWKAFALGASIAGFIIFIGDIIVYYWITHIAMIVAIAATLSMGGLFTLLTTLVPRFARLFLSKYRAETEVRQYAESLFLNKELFATDKRTGILILVSLFEKHIIILPDKGVSNRLSTDTLNEIISKMAMPLKKGDIEPAMEIGLETLSEALGTSEAGKFIEADKNELPDDIIEEKGV